MFFQHAAITQRQMRKTGSDGSPNFVQGDIPNTQRDWNVCHQLMGQYTMHGVSGIEFQWRKVSAWSYSQRLMHNACQVQVVAVGPSFDSAKSKSFSSRRWYLASNIHETMTNRCSFDVKHATSLAQNQYLLI